MKTKFTYLFLLFFASLLLNTARAAVFTVEVTNFSFTPGNLSLQSGDTVKWVWVSGEHTTTSTFVPSGAATWNNPINSESTQFEIQLKVSGTYHYHCSSNPGTMTGTITVAAGTEIPNFNINSNPVNAYPSPFSKTISISFTIQDNEETKISIYDITGKLIKVIADMNFEKGNYIVNWDGRNSNGETVNHGLYFYNIENNGKSKTSGKIVFGS